MARSFPETLRALNGEAPILPRWVGYVALALSALWAIWLTTPSLPETFRTTAVGTLEDAPGEGASGGFGWIGWGGGLSGEQNTGRQVRIDAVFPPGMREEIVAGQRAFLAVRNRDGDRESLTGTVASSLRRDGRTRLAFTVPQSANGWLPLEAAVEAGARTPLALVLGRPDAEPQLVVEGKGAYRPAFDVVARRIETPVAGQLLRLAPLQEELPLLLVWAVPVPFTADLTATDIASDVIVVRGDGRIGAIHEAFDPPAAATLEERMPSQALLLLPQQAARANGLSVGDRVWHREISLTLLPDRGS